MTMSTPTQQRLIDLFNYDAETGSITRKIRTSKSTRVGDNAGCTRKDGYKVVRVDGGLYLAHRLIWMYVYGHLGDEIIDHIDGDPGNNKLSNLRAGDANLNAQNQRKARSTSIDGFLGASRHKGKWSAQISTNGKKIQLGTYSTPEEASAAYKAAKRVIHAGCTI